MGKRWSAGALECLIHLNEIEDFAFENAKPFLIKKMSMVLTPELASRGIDPEGAKEILAEFATEEVLRPAMKLPAPRASTPGRSGGGEAASGSGAAAGVAAGPRSRQGPMGSLNLSYLGSPWLRSATTTLSGRAGNQRLDNQMKPPDREEHVI